jgi:hypothetical protein
MTEPPQRPFSKGREILTSVLIAVGIAALLAVLAVGWLIWYIATHGWG